MKISKFLSRFSKIRKLKFVYLHIPKTAGGCLSYAIRKTNSSDKIVVKPHVINYSKLTEWEKEKTVFAIIRNPFSWYASLYNFKMNTNVINNPEKDYPMMSNSSFMDFYHDVVLMDNGIDGLLKWHKPQKTYQLEMFKHSNHQIGFMTLNYLFYCVVIAGKTVSWKKI